MGNKFSVPSSDWDSLTKEVVLTILFGLKNWETNSY